jgi:hypothetical protein
MTRRSLPKPKPKLELYQRELPFDELETAPPTKPQTRLELFSELTRNLPGAAKPKQQLEGEVNS